VISQDPAPGVKSADGTVQVTVSREPIQVQITKLNASDPDGNGIENNEMLPNLTDGDLSTFWTTERYVSPVFAGLPNNKNGVGLSFTLAEGATLLKISFTITGWKGELQKLTSGEPPIAIVQLGDTQQVMWREPLSSGRIWFYQLVPMADDEKGRNGVIIDEIAFYK
jgi:hypothetical protein